MKKEYIPWICLYLGLAGLFFVRPSLPAFDAELIKSGILFFTWARIVTFAYMGIGLQMDWFSPKTPIFNTTRAFAELAILVGLWRMDRPLEVVASVIVFAVYAHSRRTLKPQY